MKGLMKYGVYNKEVNILKITKTKIVINYVNELGELIKKEFKRTVYGNVTFYDGTSRIKETLFIINAR